MRYLLLITLCGLGCTFLTRAFDATCGDGFLQDEECDDGNQIDGDGCDNNCTVTACGNGITTSPEQCDDANQINDDGCTNNCLLTDCGNAIIDPGEQCDEGANNSETGGCTTLCQFAVCGDGFVREGVEDCDDANKVDDDTCTNNCTASSCGDGIIQAGEDCDDGDAQSGDGCNASCEIENCGDDILTEGERCFAPPVEIDTVGLSTRVAVGDFSGDGRDDIALCSLTHIEIFQGAPGALSLTPLASIPVAAGIGGCKGLTAGSFGGSQLGVAASYSDVVGTLVIVSQQSSTFSDRSITMNEDLPVEIKRINLNGGSDDGLVIAINNVNNNDDKIRILSGIASGDDNTADISGVIDPFGVAVGDLGGDGLLDIMPASLTQVAVPIFIQSGGVFASSATVNTVHQDCLFVESANIVGDNRDDLVFSCRTPKQLVVREQNPAGVFSAGFDIPLALVTPTALTLTDLDGDGDNDIAVVDQSVTGQILLLFNQGDGTFDEGNTISAGNSPSSIAAGDFNADGRQDIVAANAGSQFVTLILSNP